MTQHSLRPRDVSGIKEKREPVYQISTLQSLILGNYYGCLYIEDLLKHGDTGIGTFHAVAGELIVIDGHCYRILADGSVLEAQPLDTTPFASIAYLEEGHTIKFGAMATAEALREALDDSIELLGPNSMYVVRIDGYFNRVAARTELYQHEPYKPFAKVLETDERRFAFENIEGSLVCFYFPPFMDGVNTPGWHFHFINAARTLGGHVFDIDMVRGTATLNKTDRFILDLPSNQAFQYADLANASKEDIHKVEQGGGD
ncbi:acetolactate decarboxylase [Mitsuokella jalaludinii]|uniref:acetolactate decarboxylase n=1 Tax=Mitsuokella jalaludinii TaxID=187979 RepID=UPI00265D0D24|nr:acetolactate decarboxylase [uncultured Mitsuokella sp.]